MPAYNAEKTLEQTYREIPMDVVDEVILTDDFSRDETVKKAKELGIKEVLVHEKNKGYGGNQKTCYNRALELGADIVIMVHPDYQDRGIGTDLMKKMIDYLKEKHIYMISVVFEEKLKPFYEKFGFFSMLCGQMETYDCI